MGPKGVNDFHRVTNQFTVIRALNTNTRKRPQQSMAC